MPPLRVLIIRWFILAVLIYLLPFLFGKRVRMRGIMPAFTVALIIAPANTFLVEIADIFSIPDRIIYLLIFAVIMNAALLYGATWIVPDFHIENFSVAIGLALLLAICALLISHYLSKPLIELTQLPSDAYVATTLTLLRLKT
jgi:uncharacterized membrane protein YvlD (DUF360 family)